VLRKKNAFTLQSDNANLQPEFSTSSRQILSESTMKNAMGKAATLE
jgi:hypothetical protein